MPLLVCQSADDDLAILALTNPTHALPQTVAVHLQSECCEVELINASQASQTVTII